MIIGNGDIASVLKPLDRKDILFFASGVSNSIEKNPDEFQREIDLLEKQDKSMHIVYFSTLSVFNKKSAYTEHKKKMEALIKLEFEKYTIIRLGNILWGANPHTFINYFREKVIKRERILIRDEYKFLVTLNEFRYWIKLIPDWPCEMNITGKMINVEQAIDEYAFVGQDLR